MKNSVLTISLVGCVVLLFFGLFVPLPQATGQPIDQLPNSLSIPSAAAHPLASTNATTFTFYLPIIARAPELYGYVTENGQPAQDIAVDLWAFHDSPFAQVWMGTARTDATGLYNFTVPPAYSCVPAPYQLCWYFYIYYTDYSPPPGRLMFWRTASITNYEQGTTRQVPTFDIGAPVLLFPGAGDVVSPTLTFTWVPALLPEDNYGLEIWEDGHVDPTLYIGNLGYTNAYTAAFVGNNCGGPCSNIYDRPLQWRLSLGRSADKGHGYMAKSGFFTITAPSQ